MHRVDVHRVEDGGRIVDLTRELALAETATDVEASFAKRPQGRVVIDEGVQPFGPSAPLRQMDLGGYRVDWRLDRAHRDADLRAAPAVVRLYRDGVAVSRIQRAFSVGAFGVRKHRKFVPTRWSITAVDDAIAKAILGGVRTYPLINEVRVHEAVGFDDRFLVILIPRAWRYESIEAWYPDTVWNPLGRQIVMFGDHEGFDGRTTYASIGGCYYAARLAIAEALERERRQAAAILLRETHPGYILPTGVWNVREHVREALRRPPRTFGGLQETVAYVGTRLDIPMGQWIRASEVLKHTMYQREIESFAST